jgi:predicted extracellular nuclease
MTRIFTEGFEDAGALAYTLDRPEFSDGAGDFLTRTDGTNIGGFYALTGAEGAFWFAAMDLDGEGGAGSAALLIEGIDVAGYGDLAFSGLFAEDDDGAGQDWDADSRVTVEARLDGGAWTPILQFAALGATNTEPGLDADFDGVADGPALTDAFAGFGAPIPGTGATLDLRVLMTALDAGDEDISFDALTVTGTLPSAETVVLDEGFDDAAGLTVAGGFFSDGFGDYLGLAGVADGFGGDPAPAALKPYAGTTGAFLTGMDLDGEGGPATRSVTWAGLDVAGLTDLAFSGEFAEFFDAPGDIDAGDFIRVTAAIDGGAPVTVLEFRGADFSSTGGPFNGVLRQDADGDGTGEGAVLGDAMQAFSAAIAGTGSTLDLTLEVSLDSGDEDFAVDNFRVMGSSGGAAAPAVIVSAGDGVAVAEGSGATDALTLRLATEPAAPVTVTVAADGQTEVSADGLSFGPTAEVVLTGKGSGTGEATVRVRAVDDAVDEADPHPSTLAFTVTSADPLYDGLAVGPLTASVADDDVTVSLISEVQGAGEATPLLGREVTVEAVVTGVTTGPGGVTGYFLQEEDADRDGDAATSEGIYVFDPGAAVSVGDRVRVTGEATEFRGATQIGAVSATAVLGTGVPLPTATQITLGLSDGFEAYEGMRVVLVSREGADPLTVIENFNLDRFGEVAVAEGVQYQPTQLLDPDTQAAEIAALAAANAANRITVDDLSSVQNPATYALVDSGDGTPLTAGDPITAEGPTLRLGAEIEAAGIEGVLDFAFGEWRLRSDAPLDTVEGTNAGARPDAAPEVGGDLQVAGFNVLNYFTTLGERGAATAEDLARQTDKLVAALLELDAEVVALQELENNGFGPGGAIAALVDALNAEAGAGSWAFVDPGAGTATAGGAIGTDAITAGLIYRPAAVTLAGAAVLDFAEPSADATAAVVARIEAEVGDLGFNDFQRNRPAVAATFETAEGAGLTVVSNHFKSKGDSGLEDVLEDATARGASAELVAALRADPNYDQGDGQGFWNQVRADAAAELAAWLGTGPTGAGDDGNVLVLGDLNAYAREDPVEELVEAGYTDLAQAFIGEDAYSFVFDGQRGTLDYALASEGLLGEVTGVAEWHVNADEPDLLGYSSRFTNAAFYNDDFYAASDHDPVLVGLDLEAPTLTARLEFESAGRRSFVTYSVDGEEVATARLGAFIRNEAELAGSGITVDAEDGTRLPEWVTTRGEGLGVRSLLSDRPFRRDAKEVDGRETLIFSLDGEDGGQDGGQDGAGDATEVAFEFAAPGRAGGVTLALLSDGVQIEEVTLDVDGGRVAYGPSDGTSFDEVRIQAVDEFRFQVAAVEFERLEAEPLLLA